jgi:iron-sulfur cluster repair protein YtfE (RIC family)
VSGEVYDIATRPGLPDELRVLAARYPRADWRGHANFSDLTAFWLDRHLMFREILDRMQSATRLHIDAPQDRFGPEIARYTGFFLNQLHEHHGIEDHHYFPKLMAFDPRLVRAFDMLDADHHALDGHIHGLAEATNAVLADLRAGGAGQAGPLHAAQAAFERFLDRHLADEEEVIVPIILEYAPEIG